ncbi:hypothetical protein D3C81_921690 [compost metagenome]
MRGFAVPCAFGDQREHALFQYAGATGDQINRNAHARMHVANHALGGDQAFHGVRVCMKQRAYPALHGRLQAPTYLIVR